MEGKHVLLYKTLVVGVIVLFLGVGVQPAVAKPDIVDFKPENIDKEELTARINEITQEFGLKQTEPAFIIMTSIAIYLLWLGFNVIMLIWLFIVTFNMGPP